MHPRVHARVQWAVAKARSAVLLARVFDPDQPRDEDGKWTDSGGGFVSSSPADFIAARDRSTRQQYLSPLKPDDLTGHTLLTTPDKKVGAAIDPQGDLQNVFNNGGPKGAAADVIVAAIDKGAITLDCYDGHLPRYYAQFGFVETGRIKFNPEFAHGWDVKQNGQPDVVFMAWKGYMSGGEKGAVERAKSKENWLLNERTDHYASDYDSAKAESRAVARRKKDNRSGGRELWPPADRAGDQSLARTGAGDRQSLVQRRIAWALARARSAMLLARLRAWDESQHPRDPAGTSTGGQFTSSGGEGAPPDYKPGSGKKKADIADFAKDNVAIDSETRSNTAKQQKFLAKWDQYVGEAPAEFKKDFLGGVPGSMHIRYDEQQDALTISGSLHDAQGNSIGEYTRAIDLDDKNAFSSYFKLKDSETGKNVGKQVLAANIAMYQKMGIDSVEVHANIDVGGYAWAKYGYVPTRNEWSNISSDLEYKIERMGPGGEGDGGSYEASSWDEVPERQQLKIEQQFYRDSHDEFLDSEIDNWRESGTALEDAKTDLVERFNASVQDWGEHAIDGVRKARADAGEPPIPFDNFTLLSAISLEYSSRHSDGKGDLDVTFDDDKLTDPKTAADPAQLPLPGIEQPKPHEYLTDDMRDEIDKALQNGFDSEAEDKANDADPPEYLGDNIREFQHEVWDGYDDREKYNWAERNASDLLKVGDGEPEGGSGELDESEMESLLTLARSRDPKALWAIADSTVGKELLLGTSWTGVLNLKDKETMDRFHAYVGKAKTA